HRFILEKPDQPFTPFEPKAPAMALAELPLPPGEPLHADVRTMVRDPAFDPPELNSRSINRDGLVSVANHILGSVSSGKKRCSEIRARRDRMKAEPGLESEIEALEGQIDDTLTTVEKVLDLVRYVLLSFSQQMTAWIEHVKTLGRVDQPTAVYLKALSEG